jgi:hypothetical protein
MPWWAHVENQGFMKDFLYKPFFVANKLQKIKEKKGIKMKEYIIE